MDKPNAWYGWKPDVPDIRDKKVVRPAEIGPIPDQVDLRSGFPSCYNQGELGSCTGNGIAGILEFLEKKQGEFTETPSRLFIYYNEREMEGTISEDSGAQIRDGIKSINQLGAAPESDWPYDISKFAEKPDVNAYADAQLHQSLLYERLDNTKIDQLLATLASGLPFVFGFTVYDFFESQDMATTGILRLPGLDESVQGCHCTVGAGYDKPKEMILVRNSWGTDWGIDGYFWMPFDYIVNADLADDFWVIQKVE